MSRWWCEHAVLPDGPQSGITIDATDGRITAIAPDPSPPRDAVRLAGVTIPGLANTHSHAFHRALRSRTQAGSGSFWTWRDVMYEAAGRLDPDNYRRLARAVFAEMVTAGHTVVGEFHYVHHQPDGTPYDDANAMGAALLEAAGEAGLRITLLDTLYLHGGLDADGYRPVSDAQRRYADAGAEAWVDRVAGLAAGPGQAIGAAIHSVRAVDPAAAAVVARWADAAQAPVHAHVSEQPAENDACLAHHGRTPMALLGGVGALGPRFSAIHATHLEPGDIDLLAATGASVGLCPTTERDLGDGIGPSVDLGATGVGMHLGSDSHAVIDHFVEARAVELHERLRAEQRGLHSAAALLTMATRNGHGALGWPDAGALAVGMRADLVTVRLDSQRTAGTPDDAVIEAVVFAATAADVTDVVVDGRAVVADGRHLTLDVPGELDAAIKELFA
ncbi:MAG: formimidoylglutamate deiminase [Acidimicrobiales bacterium]|nr:formimidoylglutamate deiminase [Acidimicrobiales bacterium]